MSLSITDEMIEQFEVQDGKEDDFRAFCDKNFDDDGLYAPTFGFAIRWALKMQEQMDGNEREYVSRVYHSSLDAISDNLDWGVAIGSAKWIIGEYWRLGEEFLKYDSYRYG